MADYVDTFDGIDIRDSVSVNALSSIEAKIDNLLDKTMSPISLDVRIGAYPVTTKEYWYNTGYYHAIIEVADSDKIYVSATSNTNIPIAMFYSGEPSAANYIGYYGSITEQITYTNELLTIPSGTTYIVINNKSSSDIRASKETYTVSSDILPVFASYDGETVSFGTRYTETSNLYISMKKRGGNSLFDFDMIVESFDNGSTSILLSNVTDFFSPYKIRANNNADGDLPTNWYSHFVGGNHQYNNGSSGSTPTARGTIDAVLFDNELVTNDTKQCRKIDVYWTNYIQGQNTKKADGTGREILKEKYHLMYDGDKIHIEHVFTPLEDISIAIYYGLCVFWYNASGYYYEFVGGETRNKLTAPIDANSGNTKCRSFIITDAGENKIQAMMEPTDIGDFAMAEYVPQSVFSTTARKVYFNPINLNDWTVIQQGENYFYDAWLKIEKLRQ